MAERVNNGLAERPAIVKRRWLAKKPYLDLCNRVPRLNARNDVFNRIEQRLPIRLVRANISALEHLKHGLVSRDESLERLGLPDHKESGKRGHVFLPHPRRKLQCPLELIIRQLKKSPVATATRLHKAPEPCKLKRVKVIARRINNGLSRIIKAPQVGQPRCNLIGIHRNALRRTVRLYPSAQNPPIARCHDASRSWDLNMHHGELLSQSFRPYGHGRNGLIRDHCRDLNRITVSWLRASDLAVIFNADVKVSSLGIGEGNDFVNDDTFAKSSLIALELNGQGLLCWNHPHPFS